MAVRKQSDSSSEKKRLQEIHALIREGRFDQAFRLADQKIKETVRNEQQKGQDFSEADLNKNGLTEFVYLAAVSLFGLGHIRQAEDIVLAFDRFAPDSAHSLYLQAFLQLHYRKFHDALLNYTRIVRIDPSDTFADRLIEKMKKGHEAVFNDVQRSELLLRYIPLGHPGWINSPVDRQEQISDENTAGDSVRSRNMNSRAGELNNNGDHIVIENNDQSGRKHGRTSALPGKLQFFFGSRRRFIISTLLVLLAVAIGVYSGFRIASNPFRGLDEALPVEPRSGTVMPADSFESAYPFFYDSSEEAIADFRRARQSAIDGKPNQARRILAEIELSNAGFEVKERASLLRESIPYVDNIHFDDPVSIDDIYDEPYLLRGAQVFWQGIVRSFSVQDELIFELEIDGRMARVISDMRFSPEEGQSLQVSGRIDDFTDRPEVKAFEIRSH